MYDQISRISNVLNKSLNQAAKKRPAPKSQADLEMDNSKSSSKYVIKNNKIVYVKYDDDGRLIFKVPWQAGMVNQKV